MAAKKIPLYEKLNRYVIADNGCWNWVGTVHHDGYGVFGHNGKSVRSHRASYEYHVGNIPSGMLVCHTCDNPLCINPDHLFVGTASDNAKDMIKKGRGNHPCGSSHPLSVLNSEYVIRIRELRSNGHTLKSLADTYGVSFQTISAIMHNKIWRHV